MTELQQQTEVNTDTLTEFVFRCIGEVGATINTALVVMGDKLGLYRAMAGSGPMTAAALAHATGVSEPYVRDWLGAQAAGGIVTYDAEAATYTLPPEQAVAFTDQSSPAYLAGLFQIALGTVQDSALIVENARHGKGLGWGNHTLDVQEGCERFFRPNYAAHLVSEWLPAIPGVVDGLRRGARVADLGCGYGASTILMAQAFPASTFVGYDDHAGSIVAARRRASDAGVGDRVRFDVASADSFGEHDFDLVTTFDALHDMGDPVGVARRVHDSLTDSGTWMIVEPMSGDQVQDNLNPIGRVYYGFSTLLCVPASLSQPGGRALGAQAGPARIRDAVTDGGFTRVQTVAQTELNQVFAVRP